MQVAVEIDWQCHNRQEMFHCCPPSPRAALKPALPPQWGSDEGDLQLWRGWMLPPRPPPGRS